MKTLNEIADMGDYLTTFAGSLAHKCNDQLEPLHTPGKDPLPDFSHYMRQPFEAQAHLIAANVRLLDEVGAGFINGEVGVGKSLSAAMIVDTHARQHGSTGYRAIVLCPDHLIPKWKEDELEPTIPDVEVLTPEKWWEFLDFAPSSRGQRKRWPKADHPTWLIIGRNQIKHTPGTLGIGVESSRRAKNKEDGTFVQYPVCPKCGHVVIGKDGPLGLADIRKKSLTCENLYLEPVGGGDILWRKASYRNDPSCQFPAEFRNVEPDHVVDWDGRKWVVRICKEPLFSWIGKPRRWPAARILHRRMNGWAKYLILDECHEHKSDTSARSMAFGKVLASTKYCLALTGTLTGGRADHLMPLCLRLNPGDVVGRGFEWGSPGPWVAAYGCVDTVVTKKGPVPASGIAEGAKSMRRAFKQVGSPRAHFRPGIMPSLFPEIVMHQTTFLRLEQFVDNLPGNKEIVACGEELGGIPQILLESEHKLEYNRIAEVLKKANGELLANNNMKLLGATLWCLLSYPDFPWGWDSPFPESTNPTKHHPVGWWLLPKIETEKNYVGVVTPRNLPWDITLPKEKVLVDICRRNSDNNDQTWVYFQLTRKRNCIDRVKHKLEEAGLRVGVLDSDEVEPRARLEWIKNTGPKVDVMLSHPTPVAMGLDFFNFKHPGREFNFNHLVFYQVGYEPLIMRQAAGRARRIGQYKDCSVTYLYYAGTAQESALLLAGRKAAAALQLEEGIISDEGLVGLGGGGEQAALVRAIGSAIDPKEIKQAWGKTQNPGGRIKRQPEALILPIRPKVQSTVELEDTAESTVAQPAAESLKDFMTWFANQEELPTVSSKKKKNQKSARECVDSWQDW